jgi:hypothetical protein
VDCKMSINLFDSGGGGGSGGGLPVNIILGYSQTWVPPVDGNICIHVVGAGGGGQGSTNFGSAFSGGGGGYCKKNSLAVTTSGSFAVVVGAGGAGGLDNANGGTGGTTSVSGTGISSTLTANGGSGAISSGHGAGGTASNGNVNNTGGAGTDYGGGAVGITGTGNTAALGSPPDCDVIAPSSLMGYGYICGEAGGRYLENETAIDDAYGVHNIDSATQGGFLAGGGSYMANGAGLEYTIYGGNGGIGGGGGQSMNKRSAFLSRAGNGGNGIVIIQYLPS